MSETKEEKGYEWNCKRCGILFAPPWNDTLKKYSQFCGTCQVKNLLQGLGITNRELSGGLFEGYGIEENKP